MRSRISNHLMKSEEAWSSKQRVSVSREVRSSTLRENDSPRSTSQKVSSKLKSLMDRVTHPRFSRKQEVSANHWSASLDPSIVVQVVEDKMLLDLSLLNSTSTLCSTSSPQPKYLCFLRNPDQAAAPATGLLARSLLP
jgi:hypothetical protein